jgi:glyoxylase-like metal-dependent hydrolase (beta-lactamase superfamily II)
MSIGDVNPVPDATDVYCVDTGMYEVPSYGSVYVLDAERPAVVDTGIGTHYDRVLDALDEVGIDREDLAYILPTHVHLDHAGGAGFLAEACPNATVMTHELGVDHLIDPTRLIEGTKAAVGDQWDLYADPEPVPEDRIEGLADGDEIDLGDRVFEVVHAPGHAPHQIVFYDFRDELVFVADAAGIWSPDLGEVLPTTPPPQFDLEQCLDDTRTIEARDPDVLCFGHFGPRENDEAFLPTYRRTLIEWVEAIRQKRAELGNDEAVVEHFVEHADPDRFQVWSERKVRAEERMNVRGVLRYLDSEAAD